jgi:hypothetical protein
MAEGLKLKARMAVKPGQGKPVRTLLRPSSPRPPCTRDNGQRMVADAKKQGTDGASPRAAFQAMKLM